MWWDGEDLGELQIPVEEPVPGRQRVHKLSGLLESSAGGELFEGGVGEGFVVRGLGAKERGAPGVGHLAGADGVFVLLGGLVAFGGPVDVFEGERGDRAFGDLLGRRALGGVADADARVGEKVLLAAALGGVGLPPGGDGLLVVPGEGRVGGVGDAGVEQSGGGAEKGVADLDVVVEER